MRQHLFCAFFTGVALLTCFSAPPAGAFQSADQNAAVKNAAEIKAPSEQRASGVAQVEASAPAKAASERNENVFVSRLDNDALKADGARLGSDYALVTQPLIEANYYAAEHGRPASEIAILNKPRGSAGWHGELFETHRNSVFNARAFFQVGSVQPSRMNNYGASIGGAIPIVGHIEGNWSQRKVRGMVNGNVLVPLASERSPTSTDPQTRVLITRFLAAYPLVSPNRTDIDERALNTNAVQSIDETNGALRLDRPFGPKRQLSLSHFISSQRIDAFQLVAGRNPDTDVHSHRSRATLRIKTSDRTDLAFGFSLNRNVSDLHPEPNAVGPRVRIAGAIEDLGPDGMYPIRRAENIFRGGIVGISLLSQGDHQLTFGGDIYRHQINGIETNNQRGSFSFNNNFGRTAIENFLLGTPTQYEVSIGKMHRGFRNLVIDAFFADQWTVNSRLQLYFGLRHSAEAAPTEVNGLNALPYKIDWNNFSPRFSLAWRAPKDWIARASYTISYGQIMPVTYSQIRYNEPRSIYIIVPFKGDPALRELVEPLAGIDTKASNVKTSPFLFSSDLVSPYSHQYNLTLEHSFSDLFHLRLGYLGSRTLKLLYGTQENRAVPVPGIPLTTSTVNQRRGDQRYYTIKHVMNSGMAYLDAAQATVSIPNRKGFSATVNYTLSKAIDQGATYMSTAANRDLSFSSQSEKNFLQDRKSWSNFDSPHSFLCQFSYNFPRLTGPESLAGLLSGWQLTGALMSKVGMPFGIVSGSDALGNFDGQPGDRPNVLDPSILGTTIGDPDTAAQIFRRELFSYISPGEERGNIGYNVFRKQAIQNINAAISREWNWNQGDQVFAFRFRAEVFNLTNHAQFDEPGRSLSSKDFGKITNTLNDGRVMQFRVSLSF